MKRMILLGLLLSLIGTTTVYAQQESFYLHENGVTVMCPDAEIGQNETIFGITYTKRMRDQITKETASKTFSSAITEMRSTLVLTI